jgi:hypothetical protein
MTDDRPEPKYGQYAPLTAQLPPTPEAPQPPIVAPAPPRRWDLVLTTLLLLLGVYDVVTGFGQYSHLADALQAAYTSQGFGTFTATALALKVGLAINIARITVLAVAIVVSLALIRLGRKAFWVPLAGAALAGLFVIIGVIVVILGDPAFAQYIATQTPTP